jgi:hypothetical protein
MHMNEVHGTAPPGIRLHVEAIPGTYIFQTYEISIAKIFVLPRPVPVVYRTVPYQGEDDALESSLRTSRPTSNGIFEFNSMS